MGERAFFESNPHMLTLSPVRPAAITLDLGGGASIALRPCTSVEFYRARAEASTIVAGILAGADAAQRAGALLGEEFAGFDVKDGPFVAALSERIVLIKMVVLCAAGWEGVGDPDGNALPLNESNAALLLRDPMIAESVAAILNRRIHVEAAEKNG